jgi:hypothetical protein
LFVEVVTRTTPAASFVLYVVLGTLGDPAGTVKAIVLQVIASPVSEKSPLLLTTPE